MRAVVGATATLLAGAAIVSAGAAPGAASAQPAAAGRAGKGIAKHRIGNFDSPMYLTHAPGAPKLL